jgi:hypothetical protein
LQNQPKLKKKEYRMSYENEVRKFRTKLNENELVKSYKENNVFIFDLNMGEIRTNKDKKTVQDVINLADIHSPGEKGALLRLVAEKEELNSSTEKNILWHRSYHVNAINTPEKWISLEGWLSS